MSTRTQALIVFAITATIIGFILFAPSVHRLEQQLGLAPDTAAEQRLKSAIAKTLPPALARLKQVDLSALPKRLTRCDATLAQLPSVVLDDALVSMEPDPQWEGPAYRTNALRALLRAERERELDREAARAVDAFVASPWVAFLTADRWNAPAVEGTSGAFTPGTLDATLYVLDLRSGTTLCQTALRVTSSDRVAIARNGSSPQKLARALYDDFSRNVDLAVQQALTTMAAPGHGDPATTLPRIAAGESSAPSRAARR